MDFSDLLNNAEDQNKGVWFSLLHPVDGSDTGMALLIAGPDSRVQSEAMAQLTDDYAAVADDQGVISGKDRLQVRRQMLARVILDWKIQQDGKPLPFSFANVMRLLSVNWVQTQVDSFAGSRRPFMTKIGGTDAKA